MSKIYSIYIHIPFCVSKCIYCDFVSYTNTLEIDRYVDYLIKEIRMYYKKDYPFKTIYFGGGTPSLLSPSHFKKILSELDFDENTEITVEVNPSTVNENYFKELKSVGVNRLSIGIQTFNDKKLKFLKRLHDSETAYKCVSLARDCGFDNISVDIIYSLPCQSLEELDRDLDELFRLSPEHFSIYSLIYEEGTELYKRFKKGEVKKNSDDLESEMYARIIERAKSNGYFHYEISSFCKKNMESKHNMVYWKNLEYLGVGVGASSRISSSINDNRKDFKNYYKDIESGLKPISEYNHIDKKDEFEYYIMNRLRLLNEYTSLDSSLDIARELEKKGLVEMKNSSIRLTQKGLFYYNDVILEFFKE